MNKPADKLRTETAYHEAGHALIGLLTAYVPQSVTIVPDGAEVGKCFFDGSPPYLQLKEDSDINRRYARSRVLTELAGSAALDIHHPGRAHDGSDEFDYRNARKLVDVLVSWKNRDLYFAKARDEVTHLLQQYWQSVERVAQALLTHDTLQHADLLTLHSAAVGA